MFEARIVEGGIWKKILEAIKDLLNEASFDCSDRGIQLQAMDSSHVSLVSMILRPDGFENYRCDRNITMGMNLTSVAKIMKCSNNDDVVTMKAQDEADVVTFVFESKTGDRVSEFDMKLMNLDIENLGIPETNYNCIVKMPSVEFARIVRDLSQFGESITIACNKEGIKFSSTGDIGTGNVKLAQRVAADSEKNSILMDLSEPVCLSFASRYLHLFTKAAGLSEQVILSMSTDVPLVVEFKVVGSEQNDYGYIRYYLAPKIEDEDTNN